MESTQEKDQVVRDLRHDLAQQLGMDEIAVVELALRELAQRFPSQNLDEIYSQSLKTNGELTAATMYEEDVYEYSAQELADMEAGVFERPL